MANFNVTIDTYPMASSIDSVSSNVKIATGAVSAMEVAVIAAQREAAKKICSNVDNGFYILMRSQLSQKMAACSSTMSSCLLLMNRFREEIMRIQNVMEVDYNRICQRYMKSFNALDKALENRIHELDRKASEVSEYQNRINSRLCDDTTKAITYADDSQTVACCASNARVKSKTERALEVLSNDVMGTVKFSRSVENILKQTQAVKKEMEYMPAIFFESESMFGSSGNSVNTVFVPEKSDGSNSGESEIIRGAIKDSAGKMLWQEIDGDDFEQIKSAFVKKCAQENLDERVSKEIMRLFESSKWQSLKGDQR